jgi:hypothetical protein
MAHVDLDAIIAERQGFPFTFRFGGAEYSLPPRMDMRALALFTDGKVFDALRTMLGAEQWQQMLDADQVLDDDTLKALLEAYSRHGGASLGESSASTGSSASTEGPSKPTSNGSTTPRLPTSVMVR